MKIRLELPSGVTIQQKITENIRGYYFQEVEKRVKNGECFREIIPDMEERIKQTIRNLADKIYLVIEE